MLGRLFCLIFGLFFTQFALSSEMGFQYEQLKFQLSSGKWIKANLKYPKSSFQKVPLIFVFGGFKEAAKVLDLVNPGVPVFLASFDYPFGPRRKFTFPDSLKEAPKAKRTILETLEGIQVLLKELKKQKNQIDFQKVTIIGASFGAPFAVYSAAKNSDFKGIVLLNGFAEIPNTVQYRVTQKWRKNLGWMTTPLAWLLSRVAWWYLGLPTVVSEAGKLRVEQKVIMIHAKSDTYLPRSSMTALSQGVQQSQAQVKEVHLEGEHLQPGADKTIQKMLQIVTEWMKQVSLL